MNLNFNAILDSLGAGAAFRIANAARPPANYVFATFLPERPRGTYDVRSGYMTVRTTMAGLVGADSPYPPSGVMQISKFMEQSAKIANRVTLPEMTIRELHSLMAAVSDAAASNAMVTDTVLNFINKLIVQAHLDTMEYLRSEAMTTGMIDWTFNGLHLSVDYGVPAANKLTNRTGTDAYGGTTSKFWDDHRAARSLLKQQVRAIIAHPETIDVIISNSANNIVVLAQDPVGVTSFVRALGSPNTNNTMTTDARDRVSIVAYGLEGEIFDVANPGQTIAVPFMPKGKIIYVGNPIPAGFVVGQGSTASPQNELPIGYTHLAPTVEGGGTPGRWADVRVPDGNPWQIEGRGVTNGLPVMEAPERVVILSTDMP
jgi:hypothetical protein